MPDPGMCVQMGRWRASKKVIRAVSSGMAFHRCIHHEMSSAACLLQYLPHIIQAAVCGPQHATKDLS